MFAIALWAAVVAGTPFSYKGYTAGVPIDQALLENCDKEQPDSCMAKVDDESIDGYRPTLTVVSTYQGRLSSVDIMADAIAFGHITDAFKAKYGRPCALAAPLWRSRVGRAIPNLTYTWCFATGKLVAKMHGVEIDTSEIEYHDLNKAPEVARKPKIDF